MIELELNSVKMTKNDLTQRNVKFQRISNVIASTITMKNQRQNDKNITTKTLCCQRINHEFRLFQRHALFNNQSDQVDFISIQLF